MTKILIIAYYWPPSASIASHRWLHMSRYLSESGYDVSTIIPDGADYTMLDDQQLKYVGDNVKVIRESIWEVRKLYSKFVGGKQKKTDNIFFKEKENLSIKERLSLWVRANIFVPDARVSWHHQIKKKVVDLINSEQIQIVITTGPPHSVHLNGLYAKSKTKVKWIADFRDPWTTIEYHSKLPLTKSAARKHIKLEQAVVKNADSVLTVSPTWVSELKALGNQNVRLVYNGYEESVFDGVEPKQEDNNFTIAHMGTLKEDRNPVALWEAIADIRRTEKKIKISLFGMVTDEVKESIKENGLEDVTTFHGTVGHKEAVAAMMQADLLLLLVNKSEENSAGRIPAKVFEYMRSGNEILLVGNTAGDAAQLITESKSGMSIAYGDVVAARKAVVNSMENIQRKRNKNYMQYSREQQTQQLIPIIKSLTA